MLVAKNSVFLIAKTLYSYLPITPMPHEQHENKVKRVIYKYTWLQKSLYTP